MTTAHSPFNLADFYKTGHPSMYPQGTEVLLANFTPRSAKHAPVLPQLFDNKVVWFGLHGFMQEFLIDTFNRDFFQTDKATALRRYQRRMDAALGAGAVSTTKLAALWDLGYLPLAIYSLPEGARVNIKVPPVLFLPTLPDFAWLVGYIETLFSCENWKPSTVATLAFEFKKLFVYFAKLTGAPLDFVSWMGHDFSMRGMSGVHDAMRCGAGHLLSFFGTDTIPAIDYLEDFYQANTDTELVGGSVPATEHSVMSLRILLTQVRLMNMPENKARDPKELRSEAELIVIRQLIEEDYPVGIVSLVADTFDFWDCIENKSRKLKDVILARRPNALGQCKVVFRPDSGNPVRIMAGYRPTEIEAVGDGFRVLATGDMITAAEAKGAVQCLWDIFGGTVTETGHKVLDSHVGLIYGDSITLPIAAAILTRLAEKGFASCNQVFGIGSFTYNMISRDSFGFAMKSTYAEVDGQPIDMYKDPATDSGTKKSAKGLLKVEAVGTDYVLREQQSWADFEDSALALVFKDSKILTQPVLQEIRTRLADSWDCPEPGSLEFDVL